MQEALTSKMVQCKCGHTFETTRLKSWCQKCCRPVFYHKKDQRQNTLNNYYMITIMAMVMMFITYLFVEMIASPLLSM